MGARPDLFDYVTSRGWTRSEPGKCGADWQSAKATVFPGPTFVERRRPLSFPQEKSCRHRLAKRRARSRPSRYRYPTSGALPPFEVSQFRPTSRISRFRFDSEDLMCFLGITSEVWTAIASLASAGGTIVAAIGLCTRGEESNRTLAAWSFKS